MIIRELNVEPCKASSVGGSVRGGMRGVGGGEVRGRRRARLNERSRDWRLTFFARLCVRKRKQRSGRPTPPHVKFINFPPRT